MQEPALFLIGCLDEGLYYGRKSKGYATEVVIITKRLLLDGFEG